MRTLLDVDGLIEITRCTDDVAVVDERTIDQVVNEIGSTKLMWLLYTKKCGFVKVFIS